MDLIEDLGGHKVGLLGVTFKSNTDDLRNSPFLEACRMLDRGLEVRVFDPDFNPNDLIGANLAFLSEQLPSFEQVLVSSPDEVMAFGDIIVLAKTDELLVDAALEAGARPTSGRPRRNVGEARGRELRWHRLVGVS